MPRITLIHDSQRAYAHQCIDAAPDRAVVSILAPTRTNEQNAKLWAMLEDVRRAEPEGRKWDKETWKAAFMQHLGWQCAFAMSLEGNHPFPVGYRSSHLTVAQMSDLIESIYEYGARHGVEWRETKRAGFDERTAA